VQASRQVRLPWLYGSSGSPEHGRRELLGGVRARGTAGDRLPGWKADAETEARCAEGSPLLDQQARQRAAWSACALGPAASDSRTRRTCQVGRCTRTTPRPTAAPRAIALDSDIVEVLRQHRKRQGKEREEWGGAWAETGRVFIRENGELLHPANVTRAVRGDRSSVDPAPRSAPWCGDPRPCGLSRLEGHPGDAQPLLDHHHGTRVPACHGMPPNPPRHLRLVRRPLTQTAPDEESEAE
jgi:hypothetical protein